MLISLHVKNLALIDEVEITFHDGLHILSGETGAGKSILLGALSLALGAKTDKDLLRDSSEDAYVEAVFLVTRESQREALNNLDIEIYDDEVILSRRITENRSVAKINGETVPAGKLAAVGHLFLDLHGQHEHQSLLHKKKHLELLDAYAKEDEATVKAELSETYSAYSKLKKEWEEANIDSSDRLREMSFLEHEITELEDAHLQIGEDEALEQDYRKFASGKKIMEALSVADLSTGEDGASDAITRALKELSSVAEYDESIASLYQQLLEIDNLLSDFHRDLSGTIEDMTFDEETFLEITRRLDEINRLKDKYGNTIEAMLSSLEQKQKRYEQLTSFDEYKADLKKRLEASERDLAQTSAELSSIRKEAAKTLCAKVEEALVDLNFLNVEFVMDFKQTDYTKDGYDDAEFLICLNPGEPLRPLKDVASGGELSRIMLAIKTVLAENDEIDTLIFDEIDAGISGRTAQAVSEKLSVVARKHQVICITHLPQIAAMADFHYLIEKEVRDGTTISTIRLLDYDDSVTELARMLGGAEITQAVISNAKELKDQAKARKIS